MVIIGIDPGTATTGFGIIERRDGDLGLCSCGVIRTRARDPIPRRLNIIYEDIGRLVDKYRPNTSAVEELFFNRNVKTALSVGQARGVAVLSLARARIPVAEYTPLQVKQAVCGYGRAEKRQVQEMVKTLLNLKTVPAPDDAADALAVALCHASSMDGLWNTR